MNRMSPGNKQRLEARLTGEDEDEDQIEEFPCTRGRAGRSQEVADTGKTSVQV